MKTPYSYFYVFLSLTIISIHAMDTNDDNDYEIVVANDQSVESQSLHEHEKKRDDEQKAREAKKQLEEQQRKALQRAATKVIISSPSSRSLSPSRNHHIPSVVRQRKGAGKQPALKQKPRQSKPTINNTSEMQRESSSGYFSILTQCFQTPSTDT